MAVKSKEESKYFETDRLMIGKVQKKQWENFYGRRKSLTFCGELSDNGECPKKTAAGFLLVLKVSHVLWLPVIGLRKLPPILRTFIYSLFSNHLQQCLLFTNNNLFKIILM
ncbi:MAG: hypothetical protein NTU44_04300 [Bacteroidetes bacterium]|nr:hypothetical protein [Bacteroidota bacterium]